MNFKARRSGLTFIPYTLFCVEKLTSGYDFKLGPITGTLLYEGPLLNELRPLTKVWNPRLFPKLPVTVG